jgi:hypothetical protein
MYDPHDVRRATQASRGSTERAKRNLKDVLAEIERLQSVIGADRGAIATLLHGRLPSVEVMAALKGATWKRDVDLTTLRGLYTIEATITSIDADHAHFTRLRDNKIASFVV